MAIGGWHLPIMEGGAPPAPSTDWQYWGSTGSNGIYDAMVTLLVGIDMDMDQVSIGDTFAVGIKAGELYIVGEISNLIFPIWEKIGTDTDWSECSAGFSHMMAIRSGRLYGMGSGVFGEFGDGAGTTYTTITQSGSDTDWEKVSCGGNFTMGIKGGQLFGTGSNTSGRTALGVTTGNTLTFTVANTDTTWTHIEASNQFAYGINNSKIYSWGVNLNGRTGQGTTSGSTTTATQIGTDNWSTVRCGFAHAIAINTAGELHTCGAREFGRLGNGSVAAGSVSTLTKIGTDTDWESVSGFRFSTQIQQNGAVSFAIKNGELWATGSNQYGQLNQPLSTASSGTFLQIGTIADYVQVVAGVGYGLAKRDLI